MKRSYYDANFGEFVKTDLNVVLGVLVEHHGLELDHLQTRAWVDEIEHLQSSLPGEEGHIFLELAIPRMGKRADAVLLHEGIVFVLEYKVGATQYESASRDQVIDYALDLKNFHSGSHGLPVVPVLVATGAPSREPSFRWSSDDVSEVVLANSENLVSILHFVAAEKTRAQIDASAWASAPYRPTPTIVEAALALYGGHAVEEISRSDAEAINLSRTALTISGLINESKLRKEKTIIFVTGVPGSGKTLAGLNIATQRMKDHVDEHAVFLSGNGPLVEVLRDALTGDEVARAKREGRRTTKKDAARSVNSFVQNIHHFRDESLATDMAPAERVVIFDEAQRAWTREQASKFMTTKRGVSEFGMSEPEFLLSVMDRHQEWCCVICLIGGGQEINTGEAGLGEWFRALARQHERWRVAISGQLNGPEYAWDDLDTALSMIDYEIHPDLHLDVSVRSFRSENVARFISAVIEGDAVGARAQVRSLDQYPIVLTRDLAAARSWLERQARGSERIGLVASSNGLRLKPEGVHVKSKINVAHWFLAGREDVRSSYALEDAASEFDIQGLELDWVGVCWDANVRFVDGGWSLHRFAGSSWKNVREEYARIYLKNAYRVLLTRARQGMVVFVPKGDASDPTRAPAFYDGTANFLTACGIPHLR